MEVRVTFSLLVLACATLLCLVLVQTWLTVFQRALVLGDQINGATYATVDLMQVADSYHRGRPGDDTFDDTELVFPTQDEFERSIQRFRASTRALQSALITEGGTTADWWSMPATHFAESVQLSQIPESIRNVWTENNFGSPLEHLLDEMLHTCIRTCNSPNVNAAEERREFVQLTHLALDGILPSLERMRGASRAWKKDIIDKARQAISLAFLAVFGAILLARFGLIGPLLRRLEMARRALHSRNQKLATTVAARTSELHRALEDANAAADAKSDFLAHMSHELRTPMNGVLGLAALLERSELSANQRSQVKLITSSGRQLVRIIDDVLDMASISNGKLRLIEGDTDLSDVISDTLQLLRPIAEAKGLALTGDVQSLQGHQVLLDADRFRQVLNNLIGNAIKFTEKGWVAVSARAEEDGPNLMVTVSVEDTGPGIPEEDRARIFEPFERAGAYRRDGSGIGLALTKSLVMQMSGRISLETNEGAGSLFSVRLPLRRARPGAIEKGAA